MSDWLGWLASEKMQMALAGAAGGVVRWMTLREEWRSGAISLVVGAITAVYAGPFVEPIFRPLLSAVSDPGAVARFSSFAVGLGGIALSGFIIDLVQARRRSILIDRQDQEPKA